MLLAGCLKLKLDFALSLLFRSSLWYLLHPVVYCQALESTFHGRAVIFGVDVSYHMYRFSWPRDGVAGYCSITLSGR